MITLQDYLITSLIAGAGKTTLLNSLAGFK